MSGPGQRQLPLPVQLRDEATLANFLPLPGNRGLLNALVRHLDDAGETVIYLFGAAGTGKSHLLQASCHRVGAGSLYLPLAALTDYSPGEVLEGIEALDLVCLDDVHRVLGDPDWERALFNLYNEARQRNCRLLVAGNAAPRALRMDLADLRSRLGWGMVFQLAQSGDEDKIAILRFRASRRGLQLSGEVAAFIVNRASRSLEALLETLEILDNASLAEQRALSIPFVKQVLGW